MTGRFGSHRACAPLVAIPPSTMDQPHSRDADIGMGRASPWRRNIVKPSAAEIV
jgi:hypothetical protein